MLLLIRNKFQNRWDGVDSTNGANTQADWVYMTNVLMVINEAGQAVLYGDCPAAVPSGRLSSQGGDLPDNIPAGLYEWATLCDNGRVVVGPMVSGIVL